MKNIIEIINKLRTLSGGAQFNELMKHRDNKLLQEVLVYTYDPNKKYKINKSKLYSQSESVLTLSGVEHCDWEHFKIMLDGLTGLKAANTGHVIDVANFIDSCETKDEEALYTDIILKDLRLGFGMTTITKIFTVREEPQVMLAKELDGRIVKNPRYSRKMDGIRCWISEGRGCSRKNKTFPYGNIQHILDDLKELSKNYVFDGELVFVDDNGKENFKRTTNYVKKESKLNGSENVKYICFYMLPKEEFMCKNSNMPFSLMYADMIAEFLPSDLLHGYFKTRFDNVYMLAQCNTEELPELKNMAKENKWEGLMQLDFDACYQFKRTSVLQKIKEFQDAEFEIVGFNEGDKKYVNTLGAITIRLDCGSTVNVGSGFTDGERSLIWSNREVILSDKEVRLKVQYFEKTADKNGKNSLRFPTYKGFRKFDEEILI